MPTVPSTSTGSGSDAFVSTRQTLVEKVCALKGFSTADSALVLRVEEFLNDAIRELNTYPWESAKIAQTYSLVADQQYVTLDTNFFKESLVYLTNNTTGDSYPLKGLPYVHFKKLYPQDNPSTKGNPSVYSIFNFEKLRRLVFNLVVDTNTATNYTLTVECYKRLPYVTSVQGEQAPDIPDYFENAILYGAYKRLCAHVGDAEGVKIYEALEHSALEKLERIDIMHPDAERRFRLIDELGLYNYSINGLVFPFW